MRGVGHLPRLCIFVWEEFMVLLQSLVLTGLLLWKGHGLIRKHAGVCYGIAGLISVGVIGMVWSGRLPASSWVIPVFTQGGLAGSLFIAVMFAAAVPNGSRFMRRVMPVRGELSIIASILTLGHNIAYGKTYFHRLFTGAAMPGNVIAAAICSLIMIVIMLPLFITSFRCVRRKMKSGVWKRLQRLAYGFYALMYLHVLLLNMPGIHTSISSKINVMVYSIIFLSYGCMRIQKALIKKNRLVLSRILPVIGGLIFVLLCTWIWLPIPETESAAVRYADGTYVGEGMGYNGRISVSVTIEDGTILAVKVNSAVDDDPYFSKAEERIISAVLEEQSAEVDVVSGATYSSDGLKEAIADALSGANLQAFPEGE